MVDSNGFFGDSPELDHHEYDGYGRYKLDADGKGKKSYTRATTLAKTLDNTFHLAEWKTRTVAHGVAMRPDLVARAAVTPVKDKKAWAEIITTAEQAASTGVSKGHTGSAFHTLHERVGEMTDEEYNAVPADLRALYEMYRAELDRLGITEVLTEVTVVNAKIGTAGKADGFARLSDGRVVVLDRKSGNAVDYPHSPACQLATYANSDVIVEVAADGTQTRHPMPKNLDTSMGLIIHVTMGDASTPPSVHVYEIDLTAGWYGALLAAKVRRWRNRKDLLTPYQPESVPMAVQVLPSIPDNTAFVGLPAGFAAGAPMSDEVLHPDGSVTEAGPPEHPLLPGHTATEGLAKVMDAAARFEEKQAEPAKPAGFGGDAAALLAKYKTKAALQAAARQVDPGMNVGRTRNNLASDMTGHANWLSVRGVLLGEDAPPSVADLPPGPDLDASDSQAAEQFVTETPVDVRETGDGPAPMDNPFAPKEDKPPAAPVLSPEEELFARIGAAASTEELGAIWQYAQDNSIPWTDGLHAAGMTRAQQISN